MKQRVSESLPRPVEFLLWSALISLFLTPLGFYLRALHHGTASKNSGLLEVVFGILGVFLLVRLVRQGALYALAGRTIVEISPATLGQPLDYRIAQGRGQHRPMTATLYCRQRRGRRNIVELLKAPLAEAVDGRIEGTVTLPDGLQGDWQIEVQISFARGFVLDEDYPFTPTKEAP